jgi:ABC-2 type transport system permease protein
MTTAPPTTPPRPAVDETLRTALSARPRPARPGAFSASLAFGWRALVKIKHNPEELFSATGKPVMFTLVFTYLFGGAVAGSTGEYLHSFMPGITVVTMVMVTIYTGVALNSDIAKGVYDRFRTLGFWRPAVLVGAMLGDAVRYTIASTVAIILGLALGFRPGGGLAGVLLSLLFLQLFAFSLAWVWAALGMMMRMPESVMSVSSMALFPLVFASNIFVPPHTLPGWLQAVVDVNPLSHAVTASRGLMHGTLTAGQLGAALTACAVLVGVFGLITMTLYLRKR